MLRSIRRFLLLAAAVVLGLVMILVTLGWVFQDEVKDRLVEELNTHLTAPLHQQGIELTLVKRFPQASLRIREAYMQEVRTDGRTPDTLLYAKDLYLEFSLLSLATSNHVVRELHGTGVKLYPGLDANGNPNWEVWKADTTSAPSGKGADIDLRRVSFDGLAARFRDDRSATEVAINSDRLVLGGRFGDHGSKLTAKGDVWLRHWQDDQGVHLADRHTTLNLDMLFGTADALFLIDKGELLVGRSTMALTLAITRGEEGDQLDLHANGFGMELANVVQLLPEELRRKLRRYGLAGTADLALRYQGPLDGPGPALSIGMKLHDGKFTELATGTSFRKVKGEFSADFTPNWTPSKLLVKDFTASSASGPISGHLELKGLKNAPVLADVQADLALADLFRFAGLDTLEQVNGRMKATAHVQGRLRDVADLRVTDLHALAITGSLNLRDASLKMKGLRHRVTDLNAEMALEGNDALVHGLRFNLQGNAMELTGRLRNLMPYALFKDQKLTIVAKGSSPAINLASLMEVKPKEATPRPAKGKEPENDYAFTLPALIDVDLTADLGEFRMEDFRATDITAHLRVNDQQLALEPMAFRTAEGLVSGSLRLDARPAPAYPLAITVNLAGIDISKLFAEFQNFGQDFITSRHVKGTGDAKLTFTAPLRPDFSLDEDRLVCVADITLNNGELNDHGSLLGVADYLHSNVLTFAFVDTDALRKQLQHVRFAKLENRIEIRDRTVRLPLMTINSSLMDLEVSGTHGFDGTVDDHLSFRLGDLFRAGRGQFDEFGPVVDDGTGLRIFLHMYGTTDNLQFGNDGAMAAARRKQRVQEETTQLKDMVKGIVKGTTKPGADGTPQQGQVTVSFGDDEPVATPASAPKEKKGLGRFFQKDQGEQPAPRITVE